MKKVFLIIILILSSCKKNQSENEKFIYNNESIIEKKENSDYKFEVEISTTTKGLSNTYGYVKCDSIQMQKKGVAIIYVDGIGMKIFADRIILKDN